MLADGCHILRLPPIQQGDKMRMCVFGLTNPTNNPLCSQTGSEVTIRDVEPMQGISSIFIRNGIGVRILKNVEEIKTQFCWENLLNPNKIQSTYNFVLMTLLLHLKSIFMANLFTIAYTLQETSNSKKFHILIFSLSICLTQTVFL